MKIEELYQVFKSCSGVSTDTRSIEKDCLFFALKGDNFNGNKFAVDALDKGARYVIIDEAEYESSDKTILVDDVLSTLQQLANHHRNQFSIPVIGITGTNGKTTTKELINAVLTKKFKTTATLGNLNNHIGVPLTLLSIQENCEMAIIEMGANHIGEIAFLCGIAEPNFGIITNIGTAHIEGFGSYDGVKKTKNELYDWIKTVEGSLFVNQDDNTLVELSEDHNRVTYGKTNANCIAQMETAIPSLKLNWENNSISSSLYGTYNFENILAAICIGDHFKVDTPSIVDAIETYQPTNNRSQLVEIDSNTIYLDAYNANPTSMNAAIDTFATNPSSNKLMILGDMLELGKISKEEHQKIIDKTKKLEISAFFVGSEFSSASNKHDFTYLKNVDEAIDWIKHAGRIDTQILIKGSRGIGLEKIVAHLQKKEAI